MGHKVNPEYKRLFEEKPWYMRIFTHIQFSWWIAQSNVRHYFMKQPVSVIAKDDMAESIKDDIEFGYDLEMIYGKIMQGSYGNKTIDEKYDWFRQNEINWKEYLQRQKVK